MDGTGTLDLGFTVRRRAVSVVLTTFGYDLLLCPGALIQCSPPLVSDFTLWLHALPWVNWGVGSGTLNITSKVTISGL